MSYYRRRTLCDVLEEMRQSCKSLNFGHLPGLVEEAQSMGNRMEAALGEQRDLISMAEDWSTQRKELKKTQETLDKLNNQVKQLSQRKKELREEVAKAKGMLKGPVESSGALPSITSSKE